MVVYFKIIGKGEAVINRNKRGEFRSAALAARHQFLDHQDVGFVSVAVEYPQVQNGYLVHLVHIELPRPQISHNIHILHELLQRPVLCPQPLEVALGVRNYGIIANLPIAEAGVVELHVGSWRHLVKMLLRVQQVRGHLARGTLPTQNSLPYALAAQLARKAARIVGGIGLLIEWLVDSHHFLLVALEKIGAGGALSRQLRALPRVQPRLHIEQQIGDFLGCFLEYLVGVDDSVLLVVGVGVGHDDDGGAGLDLVVLEEILLFLGELHVLAEEPQVLLVEVRVLVVELFLNEQLLELARADPGEELELELPPVEDLVLEAHLYLLHLPLRLRLHVPWHRVHPIITMIACAPT